MMWFPAPPLEGPSSFTIQAGTSARSIWQSHVPEGVLCACLLCLFSVCFDSCAEAPSRIRAESQGRLVHKSVGRRRLSSDSENEDEVRSAGPDLGDCKGLEEGRKPG